MKLYYFPGSCSMACHIVLQESGLPFSIESIDLKTKKTSQGNDFLKVNPKGAVPALLLDQGEMLTEGAVIMQYIAELVPEKQLFPKDPGMARWRALEWLNYLSTDLHKSFGPFWNPATPDGYKDIVKGLLAKKMDFLEGHLHTKDYMLGQTFSLLDAYLFTVLNWCPWVKFDLTPWPVLVGFHERLRGRPSVQSVMKAEAL